MPATTALCGSGGTITGATGAVGITNWTLTREIDLQDATSLQSNGWRERIACLQKANGTFTTNDGYCEVGNYTGVAFKTAVAGGDTFTADVNITDVEIGAAVDGIHTYVHTFVTTGTITVA